MKIAVDEMRRSEVPEGQDQAYLFFLRAGAQADRTCPDTDHEGSSSCCHPLAISMKRSPDAIDQSGMPISSPEVSGTGMVRLLHAV